MLAPTQEQRCLTYSGFGCATVFMSVVAVVQLVYGFQNMDAVCQGDDPTHLTPSTWLIVNGFFVIASWALMALVLCVYRCSGGDDKCCPCITGGAHLVVAILWMLIWGSIGIAVVARGSSQCMRDGEAVGSMTVAGIVLNLVAALALVCGYNTLLFVD